MSIEKIIISRDGASEIEKFCNFLSTLVIKNEAEAIKGETKDSFNRYYKYESAYKGSNNVYDLDYTEDDLKDFFTLYEIESYKLIEPENLSSIYNSNSKSIIMINLKNKAKSMVESLQQRIINGYEELNPYYRTFVGLPPTKNDIIWITNLDQEDNPTPDGIIQIHEVDYNKHPLTYESLFINRVIDDIIQEEEDANKSRENAKNLAYLNFIETKLSPYFVRRSPDFTILHYKENILTNDEYKKFEEAYNKARLYVAEVLYIIGLRDRYDMYPLVMIQILLASTFMNYYNSFLYDYSVKNYTRNDIYDILDSEGLSDLKIIEDIELLRKIVNNLDLLNKYKGSEKALQLLFDIIDDKSLTVRTYSLKKNYNTDENGDLDYLNEFYNKSVNLSFEENILIKGSNIDESERIIDYDEFVRSDDLWGGINKTMNENVRDKMKRDLKNQILQMNFEKLDTKYISLAKTFNIYEKSNEINSVMYMIFKVCFENEAAQNYNPLKEIELIYNGDIVVKPLELWAAQSYLSSHISGLSNPEVIRPDLACFSSVFALRKKNGILSFINNFNKNNIQDEIDILDPNLNRPIKEVLSNETVEKFLVKYDFDSNSSIIELLDQFEDNLDIMYSLADEIIKKADKDEFDSYFKIWDVNEITYNYNYIYQGHDTFTGFLESNNPAFYNYIESIIEEANLPHNNRGEVLRKNQEDILNYFKLFINDFLDNKYDVFLVTNENNLGYLNDLKILFKEYLSIYLQLYKLEQIFDITNIPRNLVRAFFSRYYTKIEMDLYDRMDNKLKERLHKILYSNMDMGTISFKESIKFIVNVGGGGSSGGTGKPGTGDDGENIFDSDYNFLINLVFNEFYRELRFSFSNRMDKIIKLRKLTSINKYTDNYNLYEFYETLLKIVNEFGLNDNIKLNMVESLFNIDISYLQSLYTIFKNRLHKILLTNINTINLKHNLKISTKGE